MSYSPKFASLTTGLLTATSLALITVIPATASVLTLSTGDGLMTQPRHSSQSAPTGSSGFSQPGWLIADDDDDDDDDDNKRGRGRNRGRDNDDNDRKRSVRIELQRAKNLARQTAERINGGLTVYRAEASMHGPADQAPCVDNGDSWTFTFLGGAPGWRTASVESIVTVYKVTNRIRVDYNGAVRTVRNGNWKGLLKLARLVNRNALVLQLDVLNKPVTNSASVFYQVYARRNNRWVAVYRTSATQLVATSGRVRLQPVVIPIDDLRLGNVDWSRLELKTIAYASYSSQQVVLHEVVQRYQTISQVTSIQRDNDDDDDDNDDDD